MIFLNKRCKIILILYENLISDDYEYKDAMSE